MCVLCGDGGLSLLAPLKGFVILNIPKIDHESRNSVALHSCYKLTYTRFPRIMVCFYIHLPSKEKIFYHSLDAGSEKTLIAILRMRYGAGRGSRKVC
jgi:hypothetical protein